MKNEFGIEVQSTIEPKKKLDFNTWVQKFNVSQCYNKVDTNASELCSQYDYNKLNKKENKNFVDKLNIFSFA